MSPLTPFLERLKIGLYAGPCQTRLAGPLAVALLAVAVGGWRPVVRRLVGERTSQAVKSAAQELGVLTRKRRTRYQRIREEG